MEDALYDSESMRRFAGIELSDHHVPWSQFDRPSLPMSEPQLLAIEICHHCGRKLLRPSARELESPKESSRSGRSRSNNCLSLSGVDKDGGLTAFLNII